MGVLIKKRLMFLCIIQLIIVFCVSFQVTALGVCRTISPRVCEPGDTVTVSLEIEPDSGSEVIAVDDIYPSEFTLDSTDSELYDDEQYHIKYLDYDDPTTVTMEYQLTAPSTEGTYTFSGIWMVDMMSDSSAISCDNQIEVDSSPPAVICSNIDNMGECDSEANCTWCSIYGSSGACIDADDWECDAIECGSSDDEYCHNCQYTDCQSGYTCEAGQCVLPTTPTPTPTETPTATPTPCTPDWDTGDWGECDGTYQTRSVTDNNDCGTSDGKPSTKKRCGRGGDSGSGDDDDSGSDDPTTGRTRPPRNTGDGSNDESSGLTRGGDDLSDDDTGIRRAREPDTTSTPDEEIDEAEDDASGAATGLDYLFYVLIIILVLMVGGFLFYYVSTKNKGGGSKPAENNNLFANPPAGPSGPGAGPVNGPGGAGKPPQQPSGKF
jgi:hypothetical protein